MTAIESHAVPAVGEVAPDFTLPSTSGEKLTLSSLRGKPVLLAFFPLRVLGHLYGRAVRDARRSR